MSDMVTILKYINLYPGDQTGQKAELWFDWCGFIKALKIL